MIMQFNNDVIHHEPTSTTKHGNITSDVEVNWLIQNAGKSKDKDKVAASRGKRKTPASSQSSFQIFRVWINLIVLVLNCFIIGH